MTIQWLGTPTTANELGQVTLRSPTRPVIFSWGLPINRGPILHEPPGQWTFAISVGGRLIGTCGPARNDTANAPVIAAGLYNTFVGGSRPFPIWTGMFNYPNCPDVISSARSAYQRTGGAVTIAASRNGVFRFTYPNPRFLLAGLPESDGTLGQLTTFEQCFADDGCNRCWQEQFANAQRSCVAANFEGFDSYNDCVNERARQFTREQCLPNFGGTGTRVNAYPWGQYSAETCLQQDQVNAVLRANNYQPIARDCKTGPLTCGASSVATQIDSSVGIPDTCFAHQSEWVLPQAGQPPVPTPTACPAGMSRDVLTGECVAMAPPPAVKKAGVGTGGIVLLAAAALAGLYALTQAS